VTPLVMLHGMLGAPSSFDAIRAALPGFPVVAPRLPGHGRAPSPVLDWDAAIDALAEALPREQACDVVGYSLGARAALGLLARHPHRVRRLLLASVHPGLATAGERATRREEDEASAQLVETRGLPALVDAWEDKALFASQRRLPPQLIAAQRATRLDHTAAGIAEAFRGLGLGNMPDLSAVIVEHHARLRLVVGADDEKFVAVARALKSRQPALHVERITGAGHNLFLEAPARLATSMLAFFPDHAAHVRGNPDMEHAR
jgi:2-succinyl-6-hydroxy-2,4-cyclohexadiene-1-carboxylate synthase